MKDNSVQIHKRMQKQPDKRFCVIKLYAGHGILKGGVQTIVINEFEKKGFYKLYDAEGAVRLIARMNPNAYMITIFACCR